MSEPLRIFIGWDSREPIAYEVAKASALKHSSIPLDIVGVYLFAVFHAMACGLQRVGAFLRL